MLIDVSKIKVENRIRKDLGDIQELADDINANGLINPPVITPEHTLIAGERRLEACKVLGYKQIEVRIISVEDYEHQLKLEISENENRKDFTFSERIEWARKLEEVERVKAAKRKEANLKQNTEAQNSAGREEEGETRDKVAKQSGFGSHDTYRKAKTIADNADPDLIEKLDMGEISIHAAYKEVKEKLEAERNARKRAEEKTLRAQATTKELQEELMRKTPEFIEKEVVKEVVPKKVKDKIKKLEAQLRKAPSEEKKSYNLPKRVIKTIKEIGGSIKSDSIILPSGVSRQQAITDILKFVQIISS